MSLYIPKVIPALAGVIALSVAFSSCSTESSSGTDGGDSIYHSSQGTDSTSVTPDDSQTGTNPDNKGSTSDNKSSNEGNKGSDSDKGNTSNTGDKGNTSDSGDNTGSKSEEPAKSVADWMPTSSATTETVSSEEVLAEALKVVNGTCGPTTESVEKGGMATWAFNRTSGDVFEQIMAPFVWTFSDGKVLQGNGLQNVNITYEVSGPYTATLNVDGNEITCSSLNVQGIPIDIKSCTPDKTNANAGETVTWTVVAESESPISGYKWMSDTLQISESGATASVMGLPSMHKQKIAPIVQVSNEDKTITSYSCSPATIVDPDNVDVKFVLDQFTSVPTNEPFIAEVPNCSNSNGQTTCHFVCQVPNNTNGEKIKANIEGITCETNDDAYIKCDVSSLSSKKYTFLAEARAQIECMIASW